jgi:hypothetical protein
VPLRTATTLADEIGGWPEGLITFATLAALLLALASLIRERRRGPAAVGPGETATSQAAASPSQAAESQGQAAGSPGHAAGSPGQAAE